MKGETWIHCRSQIKWPLSRTGRESMGSQFCNIALVQGAGSPAKDRPFFSLIATEELVHEIALFFLSRCTWLMTLPQGTFLKRMKEEKENIWQLWMVGCPPLAVSTYFSHLSRKHMRTQRNESDIIAWISEIWSNLFRSKYFENSYLTTSYAWQISNRLWLLGCFMAIDKGLFL